MLEDCTPARPRLLSGGRSEEPEDTRVSAVLEVLSGAPVNEVARTWSLDAVLLRRWVAAFTHAGKAAVTNRPDGDAAIQRDRFLAAFAHEMRTPLAVARGWSDVLVDEEVPEEMVRTAGLRLQEALVRLTERTVDVELLAAASLGRLRLDPELVRVAELVEHLPGAGQVGGAGPDVCVAVDPSLFRRVLRDVWQAGSSAPTPRSLRLEVTVLDLWVEIRVVRDADPIDVGVLTALFEPFSLNSDETGVTIGLYLARALTVAHGGSLGVDQDEDGATLWVRVPRRPTPLVP